MPQKFVSVRPKGFKWTMGGETWEFGTKPVEVPDELLVHLKGTEKWVVPYVSPAELKKQAETDQGDTQPIGSLQLQPAITGALMEAGIASVGDLKSFLERRQSLHPILSAAAEDDVRKALKKGATTTEAKKPKKT